MEAGANVPLAKCTSTGLVGGCSDCDGFDPLSVVMGDCSLTSADSPSPAMISSLLSLSNVGSVSIELSLSDSSSGGLD